MQWIPTIYVVRIFPHDFLGHSFPFLTLFSLLIFLKVSPLYKFFQEMKIYEKFLKND